MRTPAPPAIGYRIAWFDGGGSFVGANSEACDPVLYSDGRRDDPGISVIDGVRAAEAVEPAPDRSLGTMEPIQLAISDSTYAEALKHIQLR